MPSPLLLLSLAAGTIALFGHAHAHGFAWALRSGTGSDIANRQVLLP